MRVVDSSSRAAQGSLVVPNLAVLNAQLKAAEIRDLNDERASCRERERERESWECGRGKTLEQQSSL